MMKGSFTGVILLSVLIINSKYLTLCKALGLQSLSSFSLDRSQLIYRCKGTYLNTRVE